MTFGKCRDNEKLKKGINLANTLSPPPRPDHFFERVAILFAGGPAPAANAVISAAAASFLRAGVQVVGIKHGYSSLEDYSPETPMVEGRDYIHLTHKLSLIHI